LNGVINILLVGLLEYADQFVRVGGVDVIKSVSACRRNPLTVDVVFADSWWRHFPLPPMKPAKAGSRIIRELNVQVE
jgi:hypothetical protein